jgi:hypothetical protein
VGTSQLPEQILVMEPLPGPDSGGQGFSESDLGSPLLLPVVPLPEELPLGGERMGSDFQGPATVPGATTPNQAALESESQESQSEAEPVPIMDWER